MTDELEEIRKRAEAATPGPWTFEAGVYTGDNWLIGSIMAGNSGKDGQDYYVHITTDHVHASQLYSGSDAKTDAEFIAHAREDIPYLLAEIERLQYAAEYADIDRRMSEELQEKNAEIDSLTAERDAALERGNQWKDAHEMTLLRLLEAENTLRAYAHLQAAYDHIRMQYHKDMGEE